MQLIPNEIYLVTVNESIEMVSYIGVEKKSKTDSELMHCFYDYQNQTGVIMIPVSQEHLIGYVCWQTLILNGDEAAFMTSQELHCLGGLLFTLVAGGINYHNLESVYEYALENNDVQLLNDLLMKFDRLRETPLMMNSVSKAPNALSVMLNKATRVIEAILQVHF